MGGAEHGTYGGWGCGRGVDGQDESVIVDDIGHARVPWYTPGQLVKIHTVVEYDTGTG